MASYRIEWAGDDCRMHIDGGLTAGAVPELQAALKQEVDQRPKEVVLDLSNTTMLDSQGIGLLIATSNTLAQQNGRLRVINVPGELMHLLHTMRLEARLNISGRARLEQANG